MELGTLTHSWQECKLVQPFLRGICQYLTKLQKHLPFDPTIPLLGISLKIHFQQYKIYMYKIMHCYIVVENIETTQVSICKIVTE